VSKDRTANLSVAPFASAANRYENALQILRVVGLIPGFARWPLNFFCFTGACYGDLAVSGLYPCLCRLAPWSIAAS